VNAVERLDVVNVSGGGHAAICAAEAAQWLGCQDALA
jgi:hypothetical protein